MNAGVLHRSSLGWTRSSVVGALLLTLAGCGPKAPGGADASSVCTSNAQCESDGKICVAGLCVLPPSCADTGVCPEGLSCNRLTEVCEFPDGGVSSQPDGGTAGDGGACSTKYDCPIGDSCTSGACVNPGSNVSCAQDDQCPRGQTCNFSHMCQPGCLTSQDCASPQICSATTFECGPCSSANPCPSGQICTGGASAACITAPSCSSDTDCNTAAAGTICTNGTCGPCASDNDCMTSPPYGSAYTCQSGLCSMGMSCDVNACNSQCAASNLSCDTSTCSCTSSSCTDSNCNGTVCPSGESCDSASCTCVQQGCTTQDCGGTACSGGQTCDQSSCTCTGGSGSCNYGMSCTTDADCGTCPGGATCFGPALSLPGTCTVPCPTTGSCPNNAACCTTFGNICDSSGLGAALGFCSGGTTPGQCGGTGMNDATCSPTVDCTQDDGCTAHVCIQGECNEEAVDTDGLPCTLAECAAADGGVLPDGGSCTGAVTGDLCPCTLSAGMAGSTSPVSCW